jgi:hypothetical protein
MLEWMIALTAICGAVSALAIVYFSLRAALQMRSEVTARRKGALERVRGEQDRGDDAGLPRATVHRVSPTLGMVRLRRFAAARHRT